MRLLAEKQNIQISYVDKFNCERAACTCSLRNDFAVSESTQVIALSFPMGSWQVEKSTL